jgi:hypothetical protein
MSAANLIQLSALEKIIIADVALSRNIAIKDISVLHKKIVFQESVCRIWSGQDFLCKSWRI